MTKNHRRIIPERVFVNVKVGAAHATVTDLNFDLIVSTARLFHILQLDIAKATLIFDESSKVVSPWFGSCLCPYVRLEVGPAHQSNAE
jgi:hypothetical protein